MYMPFKIFEKHYCLDISGFRFYARQFSCIVRGFGLSSDADFS